MMKKFIVLFLLSILFVSIYAQTPNDIILGGDLSWLTKQESEGKIFRDAEGKTCDGMELFSKLGMEAVRFRVWVNPTTKWDGADDVLDKCIRAKALNQKIMIDFHYSDTWADPGHQTKPANWQRCNAASLADSVGEHTRNVLRLLKDNDIEVSWVQVGNEITDGMLWPEGKISSGGTYAANCAKFINAGYEAVKEVFPTALVIMHVDQGNDYSRVTWSVGTQASNGAKWDVTGLSFYPDENWTTSEKTLIENISKYKQLYKKPVMICETGINWNSNQAETFLTTLRKDVEALPQGECLGIFYWEPDAYPGYNGGYQKGAVGNTGKATAAITAFYKQDDASSIRESCSPTPHGDIYTLGGKKVENEPNEDGIYIIGDKKVLIRK